MKIKKLYYMCCRWDHHKRFYIETYFWKCKGPFKEIKATFNQSMSNTIQEILLKILYTDGPRSGVPGQQHQQHLGTCWKCTFSSLTADPLNQKGWEPGGESEAGGEEDKEGMWLKSHGSEAASSLRTMAACYHVFLVFQLFSFLPDILVFFLSLLHNTQSSFTCSAVFSRICLWIGSHFIKYILMFPFNSNWTNYGKKLILYCVNMRAFRRLSRESVFYSLQKFSYSKYVSRTNNYELCGLYLWCVTKIFRASTKSGIACLPLKTEDGEW